LKTWFEKQQFKRKLPFFKNLIRNELEPKIGKCIFIGRGKLPEVGLNEKQAQTEAEAVILYFSA
jgi:hypothetical protein